MQLFVFGGHDENGTYLAGGEKWQVLANETNSTAAMPQARSNFGAGAVGNQTVRIVGGYATLANKTNNTPERCDLVYNVTGDSWTTGACLNQSRGNHCMWDSDIEYCLGPISAIHKILRTKARCFPIYFINYFRLSLKPRIQNQCFYFPLLFCPEIISNGMHIIS